MLLFMLGMTTYLTANENVVKQVNNLKKLPNKIYLINTNARKEIHITITKF